MLAGSTGGVRRDGGGRRGLGHQPDPRRDCLDRDLARLQPAQSRVDATLSDGLASGTLKTFKSEGFNGYDGYYFEGPVTCMVIRGDHVTVGSLGHAEIGEGWEGEGIRHKRLPGTYAQVFTLQYGAFESGLREPAFVGERYGLIGANGEGVPSEAAPDCSSEGTFGSSMTIASPFNPLVMLSPSISSPRSGHVSRNGAVRFKGAGQPGTMIRLTTVGPLSVPAAEAYVDAAGKWSLALPADLYPGTYDFTATAIDGALTPSNVVEVLVP